MRGLCLCLTLLILSFSVHAQQNLDERLAREYSGRGDFERALPIYQKLYNDGAGPEYYDQYFSLLLQARKFDQAKALVSRMIASNAASPVYKVDLGRVYQQSGYKDRTDSVYKSLLRTLPRDEFRIRELAAAFYRANAYDYAVTTFTHGRKLLGDSKAFAFDLLSLYRYQKDRPMLIQEYIQILYVNPDPSILQQAQNTFSMLLETNEDYAALETALIRALKKKAQQPILTQFLSWTYVQQEKLPDALSLLISLDRKSASAADQIYEMGTMLLDEQKYKEALPAFEYLVSKGSGDYYLASKGRILYCRTELLSSVETVDNNVSKLVQDYRTFIDEADDVGVKAFSLRKLAGYKAYHLKRYKEARDLLQEALDLPELETDGKAGIKLELGDMYVLMDEPWEATLLYSQVEKEVGDLQLKQEAQFRNARLSFFRGDFVWAQVQLNEVKGATNQLIANDALNLSLMISEHTGINEDTLSLKAFAKADMFAFSRRFDDAVRVLDSIGSSESTGTLTDDLLMLRARIFIGQKKHREAAGALKQVVDSYPRDNLADDALFMLGTTYEQLNEPDKAKACYERLIADYPGSLYVVEARTRFRNLRGDRLG